MEIGVPVLVALGFILRFDITRIECRNAAIRRLMKSLGSTHCSYIRDVSADFLLMRQRRMEKLFKPPQPAKARQHDASGVCPNPKARTRKTGRYKGAATGGGGAQRAAMRAVLSGTKHASRQAYYEALRAANHAHRDWKRRGFSVAQELEQVGRAQTIAHRSGCHRIAPCKRKRQQEGDLACRLGRLLPDGSENIVQEPVNPQSIAV